MLAILLLPGREIRTAGADGPGIGIEVMLTILHLPGRAVGAKAAAAAAAAAAARGLVAAGILDENILTNIVIAVLR